MPVSNITGRLISGMYLHFRIEVCHKWCNQYYSNGGFLLDHHLDPTLLNVEKSRPWQSYAFFKCVLFVAFIEAFFRFRLKILMQKYDLSLESVPTGRVQGKFCQHCFTLRVPMIIVLPLMGFPSITHKIVNCVAIHFVCVQGAQWLCNMLLLLKVLGLSLDSRLHISTQNKFNTFNGNKGLGTSYSFANSFVNSADHVPVNHHCVNITA